MQAHRLYVCFINEFASMYGASCLPCPDGVEHLSLEWEFIWPFINEECSFNEVFEPNVKDQLLYSCCPWIKRWVYVDYLIWKWNNFKWPACNNIIASRSRARTVNMLLCCHRKCHYMMDRSIKEGICMQDVSIERKSYLNISSERWAIKSILNYSEDVWDFCWLAGGILGDVYWISPATSALFNNSLL